MIGDRLRLDGLTVVVAGAGGGGISTAVCKSSAELGANVVGLDIDPDALGEAETATVAAGGSFLGVSADVRRPTDVEGAMQTAVESFGSIHGLVHVVGGEGPEHWQRLENFPVADLNHVFELNVTSALLTSQAAARAMMANGHGGSIVLISSVAAFVAAPFNMAYGLAKASLVSMTKSMATEWGSKGIRVNSVAAGTVQTPHSRGGATTDPARDAVLALKRRGTPEELAGAVMFVLSDLAGFVTGQTIIVDGGSIIRPSYLGPDDIPVSCRMALSGLV